MSSAKEKLQTIERTFPIEDLKVNSEPFWPFFRSILYANMLEGLLLVHPRSFLSVLTKVKNATFGFFNWFKRYDYVVFSNELERKYIDGRYIDKLTEGLIEKLGYGKTLYVEQVNRQHLDKQLYGQKAVSSMDFIIILSGIYQKLTKPGHKAIVDGEDIWINILAGENLSLTYRNSLDIFLSKARVIEILLKRLRPKKIFITDYGNLALIYAAKRLRIPVIEFQHGVIGYSHPHYHPAKKLSRSFCPDYIFVFGENDVKGLAHGMYVIPNGVIPIGNYYLGRLSKSPVNPKILSIIKLYKYSVGVPTDFSTHQYLVSFIESVAATLSDCVFLVSPRLIRESDVIAQLPENVKIITDFSYQEIIRHCDFNASTNSTCCLEALSLGAMNILIDEEGLASAYFGNVLVKGNTVFVKTKQQFIDTVYNVPRWPRDIIKESNKENFMPDYDRNLEMALSSIGEV